MESFTRCGNGNGCGNSCSNSATSKWVPTLFCAAAAAANYFAFTLLYCRSTIAAVAQCEHFQRQRNGKHKNIAATAAPHELTFRVHSHGATVTTDFCRSRMKVFTLSSSVYHSIALLHHCSSRTEWVPNLFTCGTIAAATAV